MLKSMFYFPFWFRKSISLLDMFVFFQGDIQQMEGCSPGYGLSCLNTQALGPFFSVTDVDVAEGLLLAPD